MLALDNLLSSAAQIDLVKNPLLIKNPEFYIII